MAFLDSTGELTEEARAAFMEAMIEEEDSEEEDEVKYCYFVDSVLRPVFGSIQG